ncbi:hypothetical protein AAC387_Pa05g3558 [Persea americana]
MGQKEDDDNKTGFPFPGSVGKDGEEEFYSKAYDVNQVIVTVILDKSAHGGVVVSSLKTSTGIISRGICRSLYDFWCLRRCIHAIERLPTTEELESRARPYVCMDIVSCRCC